MACTDVVPNGIGILDLSRKLYICTLVIRSHYRFEVDYFQCPIYVHIESAHSNQHILDG